MQKQVKVMVKAAGNLALNLLTPLQGDLKTLSREAYDKLKAEILEDGFSFAFHVWENAEDANIYILDGHQRFATLNRMADEGYKIPAVPVNFVEAESMEQAKHKLLAAASQYGEIKEAGLAEFLKGTSIDGAELIKQFQFPEIDLFKFVEVHLKPIGEDDGDMGKTLVQAHERALPSAADIGSDEQIKMVQLFYDGKSHPDFLRFSAKLQEKMGTENLSETVLEVLREAFAAFKHV